jgi:hypothetical protein
MEYGVTVLSVVGLFVVLLLERKCTCGSKDWDLVPIGGIGYIVMILSAWLVPMATTVLAALMAIATLWLIIKSIQIREFCMLCLGIWLVNTAIVVVVFIS